MLFLLYIKCTCRVSLLVILAYRVKDILFTTQLIGHMLSIHLTKCDDNMIGTESERGKDCLQFSVTDGG